MICIKQDKESNKERYFFILKYTLNIIRTVQFSWAQLFSPVQLFATPWAT